MLSLAHVIAVASSLRDTDGEALKSQELILSLLKYSPEPFSRSQFSPGHITCTGLVIAPDRQRLLIVHHRRLDRWLLPGGHVESDDDCVWDTARREVFEETSVKLQPESIPFLGGTDVHGIPSNSREPYHLHHDLIFAFRAADDRILRSPESREVAWSTPAEFDRYALPGNIRRAYSRALTALGPQNRA